MIRISSSHLVEELEAAWKRGDGYIMGARGQNPKTGYLDLTVPESKCKSGWKTDGHMFTQYSGRQRDRALHWRSSARRVWDCNGMSEGIYELATDDNIDSKARYNYRDWCDPKGAGIIPVKYRVPGAAVFWGSSASGIHHVAYLYKPVNDGKPEGDWYLIEARGVMYGVVRTKLYTRKPDYWGWMTKYYDYGQAVPADSTCPYHEPTSTIYYGATGERVRWLQWHLLKWRPDCLPKYGIDGDYGSETRKAVLAFKEERIAAGVHGLSTGNTNVGEITREELMRCAG